MAVDSPLHNDEDRMIVENLLRRIDAFQLDIKDLRNQESEIDSRLVSLMEDWDENQNEISILEDHKSEISLKIETIKSDFNEIFNSKDNWGAYQSTDDPENAVSFEVDDDLRVTKIHRRKMGSESKTGKERPYGPSHSSIFVYDGDARREIIAKHGEGAILGAGAFGVVKLGQDARSGEKVAVKIQRLKPQPRTAAWTFFEDVVTQIAKQALKKEGIDIDNPENQSLIDDKYNEIFYSELDKFPEEKTIKQEQSYETKLSMSKGSTKRSLEERSSKIYSAQVFLPGTELKKAIDNGKITDRECLEIAKQVCSEIQKVHDLNILHRDIKPENFIWDSENNKLVVIDFGLAGDMINGKIFDTARGTVSYMPPEVLAVLENADRCEYSVATDYFSIGVLLKKLFENRPEIQKKIQPLIDSMCQQSADERLKDKGGLQGAIQEIEGIQNNLTQSHIQSPRTPATEVNQAPLSPENPIQRRQNPFTPTRETRKSSLVSKRIHEFESREVYQSEKQKSDTKPKLK